MYLNVGIDVAKNMHEACILTESGEQIGNLIRIKDSKSSIEKFKESVESAARELNLTPRIGMEATGYTDIQYIMSFQGIMKSTFTIHLRRGDLLLSILGDQKQIKSMQKRLLECFDLGKHQIFVMG